MAHRLGSGDAHLLVLVVHYIAGVVEVGFSCCNRLLVLTPSRSLSPYSSGTTTRFPQKMKTTTRRRRRLSGRARLAARPHAGWRSGGRTIGGGREVSGAGLLPGVELLSGVSRPLNPAKVKVDGSTYAREHARSWPMV